MQWIFNDGFSLATYTFFYCFCWRLISSGWVTQKGLHYLSLLRRDWK